jgi:hypothetical protein
MPTFPMNKLAIAMVLVVTLGACSMAPTYQQPQAPIPTTWVNDAKSSGESQAALQLAQVVTDKTLLAMVQQALENNRDLRKALLNVEAARAQYGFSAPTDCRAWACKRADHASQRLPTCPRAVLHRSIRQALV